MVEVAVAVVSWTCCEPHRALAFYARLISVGLPTATSATNYRHTPDRIGGGGGDSHTLRLTRRLPSSSSARCCRRQPAILAHARKIELSTAAADWLSLLRVRARAHASKQTAQVSRVARSPLSRSPRQRGDRVLILRARRCGSRPPSRDPESGRFEVIETRRRVESSTRAADRRVSTCDGRASFDGHDRRPLACLASAATPPSPPPSPPSQYRRRRLVVADKR